jgi:hypothetical protein
MGSGNEMSKSEIELRSRYNLIGAMNNNISNANKK